MTTIGHRIAGWWDRWRITIVFAGLALSFVFTYYVKTDAANRRAELNCVSVLQVRDAALKLTAPTPLAGITDPDQLARTLESNAAKEAARHELAHELACRN